MMDYGTDALLAELDQQVLTLTLNRPDARNALDDDLKRALAEALLDADVNPDVRCVILTGAGTAFCAGGDVKAMGAGSVRESRSLDENITQLIHQQNGHSTRIYELSKPVIAALPGAAAGAGMSIALACDIRIASENAFLATAFGNIGLSGDYGGSWFMTQLIGPARTRELYYTGRKVAADEALALGLVNKVVPADALMEEARAMAAQIARAAPVAIRHMKSNINRASQEDQRTCIDAEADRMMRCMQTQDHKDAVQAFKDKRKPEFHGR